MHPLMDLESIKRIGIAAAREGGRVLVSRFGRITRIKEKKRDIDIVTEADLESEVIILKTIRKAFPDHAVLSEESGIVKGDHRFQWIIDPLDGTTNFAHGLKIFCVSIAFALNGEVAVGGVFD